VFLLSAAQTTYRQLLIKSQLRGKTIASLMSTAPKTISPEATLAELVHGLMLKHALSFVPVTEDDTVLGYIDQHVLRRIDRENWLTTKVGDVFVLLDDDNTVAPDDPIEELLDRMDRTGMRKFLVMAGDRLAGVITQTDILAHLSLLRGLEKPLGSAKSPWANRTS